MELEVVVIAEVVVVVVKGLQYSLFSVNDKGRECSIITF